MSSEDEHNDSMAADESDVDDYSSAASEAEDDDAEQAARAPSDVAEPDEKPVSWEDLVSKPANTIQIIILIIGNICTGSH